MRTGGFEGIRGERTEEDGKGITMGSSMDEDEEEGWRKEGRKREKRG